jgi:hypothetical protein
MSVILDPESSPKPQAQASESHAPSPASARASATGREAGFAASSAKWVAIVCRLGSIVTSSLRFKVGVSNSEYRICAQWNDIPAVHKFHGALQILQREGNDQSMFRLVEHLERICGASRQSPLFQ